MRSMIDRSLMNEPHVLLRRYGRAPDDEIDLADAALALAALARPGVPLAPYRHHLRSLATDARALAGANADGLPARIRTINTVLFERHGYAGDQETYNDLRNADLMSVIDRRRGLPVALGILYVHAARAQGWAIEGVNFPGHFLLRLYAGAAAAIVDPFNGGRTCSTGELREILKSMQGADAELRSEHLVAAGNRQMLLRLQNNIKLRQLRDAKPADAVETVERMLLIAPHEAALWHEAGVLHERLGNLRAATAAFERMAALARESAQQEHARSLLAQMKLRLN
jgi:regulator of sirC expression with transglutaminase-like and TPR domain